MIDALEDEVRRIVWWRVLSLLALVFFFSWLDKVNIGFAALQMNADLGLTNAQFGLGAGCFSIGYVLFALPGTLLLKRLGPRLWLGSVMIACATCSTATAFIRSADELYAIRAVLGMAEASIIPSLVVVVGDWLPDRYRARAWSTLLLLTPLSMAVGGPLSSLLLGLDGRFGLAGWQWIFIVEAVPTALVGVALFILLKNGPAQAGWLSPIQKAWLHDQLKPAVGTVATTAVSSPWRAALSLRLWNVVSVNFAVGFVSAGPLFFMPLIVKAMGFSALQTGLIVAVPALLGGVTLPLWGRLSDNARDREMIVTAASLISALGLVSATMLIPHIWTIGPLAIGMVGVFGNAVAITMLPYRFLRPAEAAVGLAMCSIASSIGQFAGSYAIGRLTDVSGSYHLALLALAATALAGGLTVAVPVMKRGRRAARYAVLPEL